jgi:hypothetical protein
MLNWIREFKEATAQTKYFVLTWAVYGIAIIASTVYCYARLDYVRSGLPLKKKTHEDTRKP